VRVKELQVTIGRDPRSFSAAGLRAALAARGFSVTEDDVERELTRLAAEGEIESTTVGYLYADSDDELFELQYAELAERLGIRTVEVADSISSLRFSADEEALYAELAAALDIHEDSDSTVSPQRRDVVTLHDRDLADDDEAYRDIAAWLEIHDR
jgi:hypothetical protein